MEGTLGHAKENPGKTVVVKRSLSVYTSHLSEPWLLDHLAKLNVQLATAVSPPLIMDVARQNISLTTESKA